MLLLLLLQPLAADYLVQLPEGEVSGHGLTSAGGRPFGAWEGLPYADLPDRWQPPKPRSPWSGQLNCTSPGPVCPQASMADLSTIIGEEDCLSLNVYSHEVFVGSGAGRPVLLWVHGGGLDFGSGAEYRPDMLMDEELVVVTINYRLGLLGFLATDSSRISGNQGLRDILLALRWVQDRVHLFGGDPARVSLAGQSGGAWAVSLLLASPLSIGLFTRAIIQSGPVTGPGYYYDTREVALAKTQRAANILGCPTEWNDDMEECLMGLSVEQLIRYKSDYNASTMTTGSIDPYASHPVLPIPYEDLISFGLGPQVPVMLGENQHEGLMFSMAEMAEPDILGSYDPTWDTGVGRSTIFFSSLNLDPSLFSSCQGPWATAAGDRFLGDTIGPEDLMEWIHLLSDTRFAVGNELTANLLTTAPNITVYRYLHTFQDNTSFSFVGTTEWGTSHGDELPYIWGLPTYGVDPSLWSPAASAHSSLLLGLWASFTAEGAPAAPELAWGEYGGPGGEYALLGEAPAMGREEEMEARISWWLDTLAGGCSNTTREAFTPAWWIFSLL